MLLISANRFRRFWSSLRDVTLFLIIVVAMSQNVLADSASIDTAEIYDRRCATCHLKNGRGVKSVYPPLANHISSLLQTELGTRYVAYVILHGLSIPLEIDGVKYNGVMPSVVRDLKDETIFYVLQDLKKRFPDQNHDLKDQTDLITLQDIALIRASKKSRIELQDLRAKALSIPVTSLEQTESAKAREDWMINCQGCHGAKAEGLADKVPNMNGNVAKFLRVDGGREFLIQVPGVANSPLDDKSLTDVVNWMLSKFDAENLGSDFSPYSEQEVRILRQTPLLASVEKTRRALVRKINEKNE